MDRELKPMVSAVITAYDRKEMVLRAIASLMASTYGRIEIIYVDGNSRDGSAEAVASIGAVRVVSDDRRGITSARNIGASAARGEILLFLDSDAIVGPTTVGAVVREFCKLNTAIIGVSLRGMDSPNPILTAGVTLRFPFFVPFERLGTRWSCPNSRAWVFSVTDACLFIRRSVYDALNGYDEDIYPYGEEGLDLCWRCWNFGWRVAYVPEMAYHRSTAMNPSIRSKPQIRAAMSYVLANATLIHIKNGDLVSLSFLPLNILKLTLNAIRLHQLQAIPMAASVVFARLPRFLQGRRAQRIGRKLGSIEIMKRIASPLNSPGT